MLVNYDGDLLPSAQNISISDKYLPMRVDGITNAKPHEIPTGYFGSTSNFEKYYNLSSKSSALDTIYTKSMDAILFQLSDGSTALTEPRRQRLLRTLKQRTLDYTEFAYDGFAKVAEKISNKYGLQFTPQEIHDFAMSRYSDELLAYRKAHEGFFTKAFDYTLGIPIQLAQTFIRHPITGALELGAFSAGYFLTGGLAPVVESFFGAQVTSLAARLGLSGVFGSRVAWTAALGSKIAAGAVPVYGGLLGASLIDHYETAESRRYAGFNANYSFPSLEDAFIFAGLNVAFSGGLKELSGAALPLEHRIYGAKVNAAMDELDSSVTGLYKAAGTDGEEGFFKSVRDDIEVFNTALSEAKNQTKNNELIKIYDDLSNFVVEIGGELKAGGDVGRMRNYSINMQRYANEKLFLKQYGVPLWNFQSIKQHISSSGGVFKGVAKSIVEPYKLVLSLGSEVTKLSNTLAKALPLFTKESFSSLFSVAKSFTEMGKEYGKNAYVDLKKVFVAVRETLDGTAEEGFFVKEGDKVLKNIFEDMFNTTGTKFSDALNMKDMKDMNENMDLFADALEFSKRLDKEKMKAEALKKMQQKITADFLENFWKLSKLNKKYTNFQTFKDQMAKYFKEKKDGDKNTL